MAEKHASRTFGPLKMKNEVSNSRKSHSVMNIPRGVIISPSWAFPEDESLGERGRVTEVFPRAGKGVG